eukprot:2788057-Pyramimonas_sp.AAC.1
MEATTAGRQKSDIGLEMLSMADPFEAMYLRDFVKPKWFDHIGGWPSFDDSIFERVPNDVVVSARAYLVMQRIHHKKKWAEAIQALRKDDIAISLVDALISTAIERVDKAPLRLPRFEHLPRFLKARAHELLHDLITAAENTTPPCCEFATEYTTNTCDTGYSWGQHYNGSYLQYNSGVRMGYSRLFQHELINVLYEHVLMPLTNPAVYREVAFASLSKEEVAEVVCKRQDLQNKKVHIEHLIKLLEDLMSST